MKLYEYVDEFIISERSSIGDEFTINDLREWADAEGYDFNASAALQRHRSSPDKRAFTTERIGLGMNTFYRVVETSGRVAWAAVQRINRQKAEEAMRGWHVEAVNRMVPIANRDVRARHELDRVLASMLAVAAIIDVAPPWLDDEEEN